MGKSNFTLDSSNEIDKIHCISWGCEKPLAVLQIVHGMTEFIDRYHEFAEFLCENKIAVVGHDHLGHGETAKTSDDFGFFHSEFGAKYLVDDTLQVTQKTKKLFPDVPIFILGHSMGSFCVRNYMTAHSQGISGYIIMGTGQPSKTLAKFAQAVVALRIQRKGERYRSKLVSKLVFFQYNKGIKHPKTSVDWISKDEAMTKKYLETPFCTFVFTLRAYENLFQLIHHCIYEIDFQNIPKDMPILITSGEEDPVGDWGKAPRKLYNAYLKNGITNSTLQLYPNDRHEILNELDREAVYSNLLHWVLQNIPQA